MAAGEQEEILTVGEALNRTIRFFKRYRVENPRLDAEVLLAHVLGAKRIELYVNYERPLDRKERDEYRRLVAARARRKPVAYLTGEKEFMSLPFRVSERVLIPRPETEHLVEAVLDELKERTPVSQRARGRGVGDRPVEDAPAEDVSAEEQVAGGRSAYGDGREGLTVLELGTGSGAVAVAVAYFARRETFLLREIWATDITPEVLEVARGNAERHGVAGDIHFAAGDLFSALAGNGEAPGRRFDIVCSNPPYIPREELEELQPEVSRFEPHSALNGGEDGLEYYRRIAAGVSDWLARDGVIFLELGAGQSGTVAHLLEEQGFVVEELRDDHSEHKRVIRAGR